MFVSGFVFVFVFVFVLALVSSPNSHKSKCLEKTSHRMGVNRSMDQSVNGRRRKVIGRSETNIKGTGCTSRIQKYVHNRGRGHHFEGRVVEIGDGI